LLIAAASHCYDRRMLRVPLNLDTSPEIEQMQVEAWQGMSTEQKAAIVSGLTRAVYDLAAAGIRQRFPHASPRAQHLCLAVITLGPDLALKAFPDVAALDPP
jgi:hypothetical protein